jgi:hypothetical protein
VEREIVTCYFQLVTQKFHYFVKFSYMECAVKVIRNNYFYNVAVGEIEI